MAKYVEYEEIAVNRIVNGTEIIGDIKTNSDIRIDGKLNGNLHTKGKLVIGETGVVIGEIICKNANIEGKVEGKIIVSELLSLKSTAVFVGDIVTNKLAIEPGAKFTGSCDMSEAINAIQPLEDEQTTEETSKNY